MKKRVLHQENVDAKLLLSSTNNKRKELVQGLYDSLQAKFKNYELTSKILVLSYVEENEIPKAMVVKVTATIDTSKRINIPEEVVDDIVEAEKDSDGNMEQENK